MGSINESIVLVGGGGGVYRIARSLKHIRPNITTIQTTFDHGGHSGRLRDERGVLPPGDIRQAILALSADDVEPVLRELLGYRFPACNESSLDHATVGNILLAALSEITGGLPTAINTLCKWYGVKGKVLPVSLDIADLCVELSDGRLLTGEGNIDTRSITDEPAIVRAFLEPKANLFIDAHQALVSADKIVFCPGDLYTSLIPNTLVEGFREAIAQSRAQLFYVVNIMTKKAETHGYKASHFAEKLLSYIGRERFGVVICNNGIFPQDILEKYEKECSYPVEYDEDHIRRFSHDILAANLLDLRGGVVRHNETAVRAIATF